MACAVLKGCDGGCGEAYIPALVDCPVVVVAVGVIFGDVLPCGDENYT